MKEGTYQLDECPPQHSFIAGYIIAKGFLSLWGLIYEYYANRTKFGQIV